MAKSDCSWMRCRQNNLLHAAQNRRPGRIRASSASCSPRTIMTGVMRGGARYWASKHQASIGKPGISLCARSVWAAASCKRLKKAEPAPAALPLSPYAWPRSVREYIKDRQARFPLAQQSRQSLHRGKYVVRQELVPILKQLQIPMIARRNELPCCSNTCTRVCFSPREKPALGGSSPTPHSDPRITLGIYAHLMG